MTSVMDSGTGRSAKLADMPCAGKTGTTNDHKDGWFCGFTRYYTTAVWVGCDYPKAISNLSGSTYPAQIWKAYMSAAHEGLSSLDFLPYAQLSDDFKNQQKQEEEEHDKMREENQIEENQTDDQQTSESQQKDNTTDGSSENDNQPDNNDSNAGDQNNKVGTTIPEKAEETLIRRKMEKIPINRTIAEPRIIAVIPERVEIPVVETYNKHI